MPLPRQLWLSEFKTAFSSRIFPLNALALQIAVPGEEYHAPSPTRSLRAKRNPNTIGDNVPQIFISHSQYDQDIRKFFDEIFSGRYVRSVRLEFERYEPPAANFILNQIRTSDALFVLLGPNITREPATKIWVGFETGAAASIQPPKEIWVFEPIQSAPIPFPVPFLHHYMLYDFSSQEHRDYITRVVRSYEAWIPVLRQTPTGLGLTRCGYRDCQAPYYLHTDVKNYSCPVCRRPLTR